MRIHFLIGLILFCSSCANLPERFPDTTPTQQSAVVFDIDGTLTPSPWQFWRARDGAAAAVSQYAALGYEIIYITARIQLLQCHIPGWLEDEGFPLGNLYVTQSAADRADAETFKRRVLREWQTRGWEVMAAFGDSSSDFTAYSAEGVDQARIIGLRRAGRDECEPGPWAVCLSGWEAPLPLLNPVLE